MLLSFKRYSKIFFFVLLVIGGVSSCKKDANLSNLAGLTAFSIQSLNVPFTIDETAGTISNKDSLPFQTNVSALVAQFTAVPNASVKVGSTVQVSGTTINNFSAVVVYTVVAQNGSSTRAYNVIVNVAKVDPKTVSWQQITADAGWGNYHNMVAGYFNSKFYAFGATFSSFGNSVAGGTYTSTDGVTWAKQTATDNNGDPVPYSEYSALVTGFNSKMYFLGGHRPGVGFAFDFVTSNTYSTSDGAAWTVSAPVNVSDRFSVRERIGAVVFNNKIFVVGGNAYPFGGNTAYTGTPYNDIWSSPDGAAWTQVTTTTAFTGRFGHSVAVYNNEIFLAGGENAGGVLGDLWVSEDGGVTWKQLQSGDVRALPANFPARTYFSFFVQDNTLYIVGGLGAKNSNNAYTYQNDVWKGVLVK